MLKESFDGHMNISKYAKLAKCSYDTALGDIQDLVIRGIFVQNTGGGRSTSYRLKEIGLGVEVKFNKYGPLILRSAGR